MSPGHGRRRGWRLALATAAAMAVTMGLPAAASTANAATATGDANPTACAHRVNNTPQKLVDCVNKDDLWAHMVKFQQIADANPGADGHPSRNSGEPGYKASADYVADVMRAAGYNVTLQEYKFDYFSFVGTPVMREDSPTPHSFGLGTEFNPGPVAGSATGEAATRGRHRRAGDADPQLGQRLRGVRLRWVHPGQHRPDPARHVHLRPKGGQRRGCRCVGGCHLQRGQPRAHQPLLRHASPVQRTIPVLFTTYAVGTQLLAQYVPVRPRS